VNQESKKAIKKLKDEKRVQRVGSLRDGNWQILKNNKGIGNE
jgi:hypothetical protein